MLRKQLVAHIISEFAKDTPDEKIKDDLLKEGWPRKEIEEAFFYSMFPEKLRHFSLSRAVKTEVPVAVVAIVLLFSITVFSFVFFYFRSQTFNYTINLPAAPELAKPEFKYGEQPALSNPAFFEKVKNQFIADRANFVEVDLSAMIIRSYKNGVSDLEIPIKTKGREGSWWETPAGLYKAEKKERTHFSGMGHVYMPWSIAFQGNFYIHGWPYYPDGTPVATKYSGGCVRLADSDAEKLYDEIDVGTPILVYKEDFKPDSFVYSKTEPLLSGLQYLAADLRNDYVFLKKNSDEIAPIASITKLVVALVATEYINLDSEVIVPKEAIIYTSKPRLVAGSKISVYQLLFPLLLESSNEAAETIARSYGRDNFIKRMNDKVLSIGMAHTHLADPSGASEENVSTAEDLFMLAKYIYNNRSFIWNITSGRLKNSAYGPSVFSNLGNFNSLADNPSFFGGKVGKTTAAKETDLAVFELPLEGSVRPAAIIILGSNDEKSDLQSILDYIQRNF